MLRTDPPGALRGQGTFLGATPGIIQVLHTWGQELNFHPHVHCIVSGGGLSPDGKLKTCGNGFFVPAKALASKFRGKLLASLDSLYKGGSFPSPRPVPPWQTQPPGLPSGTGFTLSPGAPTSGRPSMASAMPLNIWGVMPTVSPSPTPG